MKAFSIFGNDTTVALVHWKPEPDTRGTWSVLSTCLVTMTLCLWTSLHLNVPQYDKKADVHQRWRKLGMLIAGLLAPELVAYIAWYQRQAAVKLTAKMKRILDDPPCPKHEDLLAKLLKLMGFRKESEQSPDAETQKRSSKRRHVWTNVHSFYAVMGGFAFDTSESTPSFLPNGRVRLTLNLRGLVYVAEKAPWLLPDLSRDFIKDKSKASGLAKLLVCLQAIWFCVQCILRLAQGYAISLLELNVFGHCVCALLIYALWWNKPLDVEEPTLLSGEEAWGMCALMCMASCRPKPWITRMSDLLPWDYSIYLGGGELVNGEQFGTEPYYTWKDVLRFNFDRPDRLTHLYSSSGLLIKALSLTKSVAKPLRQGHSGKGKESSVLFAEDLGRLLIFGKSVTLGYYQSMEAIIPSICL